MGHNSDPQTEQRFVLVDENGQPYVFTGPLGTAHMFHVPVSGYPTCPVCPPMRHYTGPDGKPYEMGVPAQGLHVLGKTMHRVLDDGTVVNVEPSPKPTGYKPHSGSLLAEMDQRRRMLTGGD